MAWGAKAGFSIGLLFGALAAINIIANGGELRGRDGPLSIVAFAFLYFAALPAIGAVFGVLLPWMRTFLGAGIVGSGVMMAAAVAGMAWKGTVLNGVSVLLLAGFAIAFGHIIGLIVREFALVRWRE